MRALDIAFLANAVRADDVHGIAERLRVLSGCYNAALIGFGFLGLHAEDLLFRGTLQRGAEVVDIGNFLADEEDALEGGEFYGFGERHLKAGCCDRSGY